MREKHSLQDRVDMLGAVPHAKVQSVLVKGHIFLNRFFMFFYSQFGCLILILFSTSVNLFYILIYLFMHHSHFVWFSLEGMKKGVEPTIYLQWLILLKFMNV